MTPTFDTLKQAQAAGYELAQNHLCVDRYRGVRITLVDSSGGDRVGLLYKVIVMHPTERDAEGYHRLLYQSDVVTCQVSFKQELNHAKKFGRHYVMVDPNLFAKAMEHIKPAIDHALGDPPQWPERAPYTVRELKT